MTMRAISVAVFGGGIIGLSCAWEMARRGARVTLIDKHQPGQGATYAAAGMLGARYEYTVEAHPHPKLQEIGIAGADLWQEFAAKLQDVAGCEIGYKDGVTYALAPDPYDPDGLEVLADRFASSGIDVDILHGRDFSDCEPGLSTRIAGAVRIPREGQVDNRLVAVALLKACRKAGVSIIENTQPDTFDTSAFDAVLWAVGAAEGMASLGVEPVKGAAFSVRPTENYPKSVLRFAGNYIVPKRDRVVIGASEEAGERSQRPDDEVIGQLRACAARICPALETAEILETWAGLRPGTPDRAPLLGRLADGRFIATGHYRNGILLAPITAQIMADMILDGKTSPLASAFAADRFMAATP